MPDSTPYSDTGVRPDRGSPPPVPRWVKASAIVVILVVLLLVGMMLIGGGPKGKHGPGRHGSVGKPAARIA